MNKWDDKVYRGWSIFRKDGKLFATSPDYRIDPTSHKDLGSLRGGIVVASDRMTLIQRVDDWIYASTKGKVR